MTVSKDQKIEALREKEEARAQLDEEIANLTEDITSEAPSPVSVAQFVLFENGQIDISVNWDKSGQYNTDGLGRCIGSLLNEITSGNLNKDIYKVMLELTSVDITTQPTLEAAVKEWTSLIQSKDRKFVVHPGAVFSVTKAQGGQYDEGVSEHIDEDFDEGEETDEQDWG
jgi:hypothetical protein